VVVRVFGGGPAQIRIYGGGQIEAISRTVSVETNANPDGLGAWGSFRFSAAGGVRGDVTCLALAGNSVLIGGLIREGPANLIGGDFLYAVTDNGPPGSGADTAGFADVLPELDTPPYPGLPANFPQTCPPTIDLNVFGAFRSRETSRSRGRNSEAKGRPIVRWSPLRVQP
jgi:hypothetical protein